MKETVKPLLLLVLDKLVNSPDSFRTGLCMFCYDLLNKKVITDTEYFILREFIETHPPEGIFHKNEYYWEVGDIAPRISYLREHIENMARYS